MVNNSGPSLLTPHPSRFGKFKAMAPYTASELLDLLEVEYGPLVYQRRLDPISELVFTILSQHTSDLNAERASVSLKEWFGSWEVVASAPVEEVEAAVRSAGLAKQKAPRIVGALRHIQSERNHLNLDFLKELPLADAKAWLRELPGVGPKTAAVVLLFSLGMPAMPVDTHVHRVAKRLGIIGKKITPDQAHDILEPLVKPSKVYAFHVSLITHGRRVCHARRPACANCILRERCPSRQN